MNKIYRKGLDIENAFSSGVKRVKVNSSQSHPIEPNQSYPIDSNLSPVKPTVGGARVRIKQFFRPVAQFMYRVIKLAFRPVAFRMRRYLTEGLHQDILQELQRVSTVTLQEMQATQLLSAATLQKMQDIQLISLATMQEIQTCLASLYPSIDRIERYSVATACRFAINCGQDVILVRTEVGFILCSAYDYAVLACLIEAGELELGTCLLIQRLLRPDDVFVDVGSNLGMHTLAAARAMKGRGKIIAFEPFEPTKRLLEKTVWMNGFSDMTEVHQAVVSNIPGCQKLFLDVTNGQHSLFDMDTPAGFSSTTVSVPIVRLDGVIHPGQKVDLLKINAEGAELEVLNSGMSLVVDNSDIALVVEFCPSRFQRSGHTTEQWLETFTKLGLLYRVIHSKTGLLEDWSPEQLENAESINLFFARENSNAWQRAQI